MNSVKIGPIRLGEGKPKIIVPITEETDMDILDCANFYRRQPGDIVEWRLDFYEDFSDYERLVELCKRVKTTIQKPLLVTFRTLGEGGEASIGKGQYVEMYRRIIQTKAVDAIDIEFDRGQDILDNLIPYAHKYKVKVIVSHHDFIKTPSEKAMIEKLRAMGQTEADICKMAVMPHDTADVLRLMTATHQTSTIIDQPLITMSMGAMGRVTRVAGEVFHSVATFGAIEGMISAPGQMDVEAIEDIMMELSLEEDPFDDDY
ncbi:type I 3-dehydroquinate dehydratase [Aerococcus agrisoli]|uniref:3-dehydroquinate dehydratase n=1 Tax=Aerococcus agrisoli TaxID=2487350 RepID=A0A3N4G7A1_9LACT|nr:type I 3-dehydroquinate dehydratase [Aerococcus agrisoli]RPA57968.1 type I 3-dehydroquinate dehydratase [Aerococcus agrisoli]